MAKNKYFKPLSGKYLISVSLREKLFRVFTAHRASAGGVMIEEILFTDSVENVEALKREVGNLCEESKLLTGGKKGKWKDAYLLLPDEYFSFYAMTVPTSTERDSSEAHIKTLCLNTSEKEIIKLKQINSQPNSTVYYGLLDKNFRSKDEGYQGNTIKEIFQAHKIAIAEYAPITQARYFGLSKSFDALYKESIVLIQIARGYTSFAIVDHNTVIYSKTLPYGEEVLLKENVVRFNSRFKGEVDTPNNVIEETLLLNKDYAAIVDNYIDGLSDMFRKEIFFPNISQVIILSNKQVGELMRGYQGYRFTDNRNKHCETKDGVKYLYVDEDDFISSVLFQYPEINGEPYAKREV